MSNHFLPTVLIVLLSARPIAGFLTIRADSFIQACRVLSGVSRPVNCLTLRTCCIDKCQKSNETYSFSCKSAKQGHVLPKFSCQCYRPISGKLDRTRECKQRAPGSCSEFASCCRRSCPGDSFQVSCRLIKGRIRNVGCECVREPVTMMELTDHCDENSKHRCIEFSRCCLDTCTEVSLPYIAVTCKDYSLNVTLAGCKCSSHLFSELSATEACKAASAGSCKAFRNCCTQSCPLNADPIVKCANNGGTISAVSCKCAQSPIILRDSEDCLSDVTESADCNTFGLCCKDRCAQRGQSYSFNCKALQGRIATARCVCKQDDGVGDARELCKRNANGECLSFNACCAKNCEKRLKLPNLSCRAINGKFELLHCSCQTVDNYCSIKSSKEKTGCKGFQACCLRQCRRMGRTYTMSCKVSGDEVEDTKCKCV